MPTRLANLQPGVRITNCTAPDDPKATYATIRNRQGVQLKICSIGASIVALETPDRQGDFDDIVLGFDSMAEYRENPAYLGSIVGRCANRISGGTFILDDQKIQLPLNDGSPEVGQNHLHGGPRGFSTHDWTLESIENADGAGVRCSLVSADGDQGYPGELRVLVEYLLDDDNRLRIHMSAETNAPTLCNLAQHAYWNLAGHASGSVAKHTLEVFADKYLPLASTQVPTGATEPVAGTPFDFRKPKSIGINLLDVGGNPPGYDNTLVVNGDPGTLRPFGRISDPVSGRTVSLSSDQPGVHLYTANFLDGSIVGKQGAHYERHGGLCLETQQHTNSINTPGWKGPVLRPGEHYQHRMTLEFGTDAAQPES